jgi:hypothetical protein
VNDLTTIYELFEQFGTGHSMVSEFKLLNSLEDLDNVEVNHRGLFIALEDANISREAGNPIYDVNFNIVIVDKVPLNNPLALINSNQENLFVMGQLQDYFIQNLDGEQNFQEVSMRGFSSEDYNITASVSNATFIVGRGPSSRGIDI